MIQDIYIIGATGKVGQELVKQVFEKGDTDPSRHVNPTRIVGLASSTHTLYLPHGISQEQASVFTKRNYAHAQKYGYLEDLLEAARYGLRGDESTLVFIDATALNEPMTQFHLKVVEETPYGIVTANKNPIALSDYATFKKLTHDFRRYGYSCSVMAGAESVPYIRDARDLNAGLKSIDGCLSGTCGRVPFDLESGVLLSVAVRGAHKDGDTEPHPRDDFNGLDVARKLVVLARTAGYPVGIKDVQVEPFIPQEYLQEDDVGTFLDNLVALDGVFRQRMNNAQGRGLTLRYIAHMDVSGKTPVLEVSLQEVPKESMLGELKGKDNRISIVTDVYPNGKPIGPVPGAGLDVTAENIRRDLLYLLPQRKDNNI